MTMLKDMKKQADLIKWIQSIPEDGGFTLSLKKEIIAGIEVYEKNEGVQVIGLDFYDCEDAEDVVELCGISKSKAKKLLRKIGEKKQEAYNRQEKAKGIQPGAASISNDGKTFTLQIQGSNSKLYKIKNMSASTKIYTVKARFLSELGNDAAAKDYQGKVSKWNKNGSDGAIELKYLGKNMADNKTLGDYKIGAIHMPLIVSFKVIGGAECKTNDTKEDDEDRYRNRKFRKKNRKYITLSSKPDCIMGYTDADGIKRAEMPCGCVFASDTTYRYMKSVFEKNFQETKIICPMGKKCKGTDKQRVWPWALVFIIADLSEKEVMKYTKAIENRLSGSKNCPHCGAVTERPDNLRISRVRCTVCNKSDWCWNCSKVWNHGGLGPICGNKNCMGAQINIVLKNCGTITAPSQWSDIKNKGKEITQTRACPKCLSPLEYTQACKHIWCICCPHEFCFNCLGDWKTGECSHSNICDYTKVQVFE